MNHETQSNPGAFHIREDRDGDSPVVFHPGDNDIFVRTGKQVIEACRLDISIELWLQEFQGMQEFVQHWIHASHAHQVRSCFLVAKSARVVLFFVPPIDQFDFDLADELACLNSELIQQFNVGPVEVHQIPWNEIDRYLDVDQARLVYGQRPSTHQTVDA